MSDADSINNTRAVAQKKRAIVKGFAVLFEEGYRPLKFEAMISKSPEPIGLMFLKHIKRPGAVFTSVIHERNDVWIYGKPEFAGRMK